MSQQPETHQPEAKPTMSLSPEMKHKLKDAATSDVAKHAAKAAAKEGMSYEKEHGQEQLDEAQQKVDDAKAQAQGMFAKYCGCFSS